MERYAKGLVGKGLVDLVIEALCVAITPYFDCLVHRASRDQVLFYADIHAIYASGMKREDKVLVLNVVTSVFKIYADLQQLLSISRKQNGILRLTDVARLNSAT